MERSSVGATVSLVSDVTSLTSQAKIQLPDQTTLEVINVHLDAHTPAVRAKQIQEVYNQFIKVRWWLSGFRRLIHLGEGSDRVAPDSCHGGLECEEHGPI